MIQSGDESSDCLVEDDDELISDKLQKSFMDNCEEAKKERNVNTVYFCEERPYDIERMFILFSFYQEEIASIGINYDCKNKISLNKIRVISESSKDAAQNCMEKVYQYIEKIVYVQLEHKNGSKILTSPYFNKQAEEKGFKLCKFNNHIYCHSNKMSEKDLKRIMKDLFSGQQIFVVNIKSTKSKQREIYNHYRSFIKKMKQYHKEEFQSRDVAVELDYYEVNVNCIGVEERNLVAVKNMFKNLLQSTVILIIRYENQDGVDKTIAEVKQYTKSISKFPVSVAKVQKRCMTIISKQNIIRKLLQKPKIQQLIGLKDKTEIGMFIPRRYNFNQRKIMIQEICTKKGYDFTTLGGIYHFFKKMFIHEDQQIDPKELLSLINQILEAIKDNKERFDIPSKYRVNRFQNKELQVTEGEYYSNGDNEVDEKISKILRRDVIRQNLKMSKPALVKYRVSDADESENVYWYENDKKQKVLCEVKDMRPGIGYFSGKYKKQGNEIHYLIEAKYTIL